MLESDKVIIISSMRNLLRSFVVVREGCGEEVEGEDLSVA